jgi:hypothetical protein
MNLQGKQDDFEALVPEQIELLRKTLTNWPSGMCSPAYAVPRLIATIDALEKENAELRRKAAA